MVYQIYPKRSMKMKSVEPAPLPTPPPPPTHTHTSHPRTPSEYATACLFGALLPWSRLAGYATSMQHPNSVYTVCYLFTFYASRKHAYIILTPLNPTFI